MDTLSALPPTFLPDGFRTAVTQFAQAMGLDAAALLDGHRFDYKGIGFRLETYGGLDPDGLYLLAEVGQFTDDNSRGICRRLLELNGLVPAARLGYYMLMPGTNIVLFCMRIDLDQADSAHDLVAAALQVLTGELERTLAELTQAAEKAAGQMAAAAGMA